MGRVTEAGRFGAALAAAAALGFGACATGAPEPPSQVLDSRVRNPSIEVDGIRKDWEGDLTRVGDRDVFAGFHRRGDVLYVAVVSQDAGFDARVFTGGLTLWVDTAAERRQRYGVRFPVFGAEARKRLRADSAGGDPGRARMLRAAGSDFVVVRDGEEEQREGPEAGGIRVAATIDRGLFTYELRLPLGAENGGPGLPADDTISVGLLAAGEQAERSADTTAVEAPARDTAGRRREGEERAGGVRSPRTRGVFGPGGSVPPLEIWVRVDLEQEG